jgi:hypothetical protein
VHFTLCDYMMEIVQNAVESRADTIRIRCDQTSETCFFSVEDNGCGMTPAQLQACQNPFAADSKKHPGRKMGLGIPLLAHCATSAGGRWHADSEPGRGTRIEAAFDLSHLDTPPLGDLADLWVSAMTFAGDYEMIIERTRRDAAEAVSRGYTLGRREIREVLGDLNTTASLTALRAFIIGREAELQPG